MIMWPEFRVGQFIDDVRREDPTHFIFEMMIFES